MKKIMIVFALVCLSASPVFAAALATGDVSDKGAEILGTTGTADADSPIIGKLSSGVRVVFEYSENAYAVQTGHEKGVKSYATASGDTKIYSTGKDSGSAMESGLTDSEVTQFDSGWTEL